MTLTSNDIERARLVLNAATARGEWVSPLWDSLTVASLQLINELESRTVVAPVKFRIFGGGGGGRNA